MRHIERVMKSTNLNIEGLHMHTGSEIKDPEVFLQGLEIMFELSESFQILNILIWEAVSKFLTKRRS